MICPSCVTATSTLPDLPRAAGDWQVIWVGAMTVTWLQGSPPTVTAAPLRKLSPVRVKSVMPLVGPVAGETDASVGPGAIAMSPTGPGPVFGFEPVQARPKVASPART